MNAIVTIDDFTWLQRHVQLPLGESHYSLWRLVQFAVGGFLASSTFHLRLRLYLAFLLGVVPAALGRLPLEPGPGFAGRAVYHVDPASTYL